MSQSNLKMYQKVAHSNAIPSGLLSRKTNMEANQINQAVDQPPYKLEHTLTGKPYIALKTSSSTPIYLTEFYPADATAVQAALSLPSLHLNLISIPHPYTLADAEWWINLQLTGNSNLPLQVLRAGDPETGLFVGSVSLMPANSEALLVIREKIDLRKRGPGEDECELGYYLHPGWRGKGIMRNAVQALICWARGERGVENVIVRVLEGNRESRGVIESLREFVRQEEMDDWVDWPEGKGGGKRRILVWKWMG